jgi:putative proteasome-type protease
MVEAVRIIGDAVREVHHRDAAALNEFGIDFNAKFIFGGQIKGEGMRLFHIYSAGNFIEATYENPYFQIGEAKYGKPIIDRVIQPETPLDEAAKCALISMDSTLKSNISVGLPLDLLVYEADTLRVTKFVHIDGSNQYMAMIRNTWGSRLKQVFAEIPDPTWFDSYVPPGAPRLQTEIGQPVRAPLPPFVEAEAEPASPIQLVAGQVSKKAAR